MGIINISIIGASGRMGMAIVEESKKIYVDKINIFGNNITSEEFIRDNLIVDEGDPFNKILHTRSINNLKSKNLFAKVESKIKDTVDK